MIIIIQYLKLYLTNEVEKKVSLPLNDVKYKISDESFSVHRELTSDSNAGYILISL